MKVTIIFILIIITRFGLNLKKTYNNPFVYRNSWKLCKCELSERCIEEYLQNFTCKVHVYNRTYSTFTIAGYSKKPMLTPYFELQLYYKYGTIYREIINVPKINICEVTKIIKTNTLWRGVYDFTQKLLPGVIHECPYNEYVVKDISFHDIPTAFHFPQGDYRAIAYIYDSFESESLVNVTLVLSLQSPIKDSFG
ncbi:hypothetical protein PVAND_001260 [Polypedilum vanderplanki]|uniref:MD-2-related lipid-recognition domain-containing protein n=1 Tax=Polypedilum vanderplanki TaxID=319348 RepID=A0A9J6BMP1_POLVA|nr:hypothetical protein PVAND_001260 [Polypedilum vanderplanki]